MSFSTKSDIESCGCGPSAFRIHVQKHQLLIHRGTQIQLQHHHRRHKKRPQTYLSTFPVPSNVALPVCIAVRLHASFAGCNRRTYVIATRTQAQHDVRLPSSRWITPMRHDRCSCQRLETTASRQHHAQSICQSMATVALATDRAEPHVEGSST